MAEAVDNWDELAPWWRREAATDLVYREDIGPMLRRLMLDAVGPVIDLGCGEGQWLRWLSTRGVQAFGCDRSFQLLTDAAGSAPVVCAELPGLSWLQNGSIEVALSVFVLDLIADEREFFSETIRVVRPGGSLIVVINHPGFTAPGSGPLVDVEGEVLWRWGSYLKEGSSLQPAGDRSVVFYHRSMAGLLTAAAEAGWALRAVEERPLGAAAIDRDPGYVGQEGIPRFFGARWKK